MTKLIIFWLAGLGERGGVAPYSRGREQHLQVSNFFKASKQRHSEKGGNAKSFEEEEKNCMLCLNMILQWWHPMPWPNPNMSKVKLIKKRPKMSGVRYLLRAKED